MKTCKLIRMAAVLAVTGVLTQVQLSFAVDQWQTVNDYQLAPGLSASGGDIGVDPNGNIYCVGSATPDVEGNRMAIVQTSLDQGASWTVLDTYAESDWQWAHWRGFAADQIGGLYVAGELYNAGQHDAEAGWQVDPEGAWVVRESHDGGLNWTTAEIFQPDDKPHSTCGDIKVSPEGHVYAAGTALAHGHSGGSIFAVNPSWVVRKRGATETEFHTVDSVTTSSGWTQARSIGFHPDGVFVVGHIAGPNGQVWTVRRSSDGEGGWETVDDLQDANWIRGSAEDIAVDSTGAIYVAGFADYRDRPNLKVPENLWVVRRSEDVGETWTTVDSFRYATRTTPRAQGIIVNDSGVIFVSGYVTTTEGDRWLVRKGTPTTTYVKQGKTWLPVSTVEWVISDDLQAHGGDVTCDVSGNVYVTGRAADDFGVDHWITRKLAAP